MCPCDPPLKWVVVVDADDGDDVFMIAVGGLLLLLLLVLALLGTTSSCREALGWGVCEGLELGFWRCVGWVGFGLGCGRLYPLLEKQSSKKTDSHSSPTSSSCKVYR